MQAELDRAKRENDGHVGRAFLITPDAITDLAKRALRARGIVHLQGTLEEFVAWLKSQMRSGLSPVEVLQNRNLYTAAETDRISKSDIAVAHSLFPINAGELRLRARRMGSADYSVAARRFLSGFPPTWPTAASDIPVNLSAADGLYAALEDFIGSEKRLLTIIGQSGSGKSTALMQSLLRYGDKKTHMPIFELSPDVKSVTAALNLVNKLHPDGAIIFIPDLFVFGDTFVSDIESIKSKNLYIVSAARTNEWVDRLSRYLGSVSRTFKFERFSEADIDPIISRILKYVPSPRFRQLSSEDQRRRLKSSRSQLLIALKEATESNNFTDIISHEYEKLPDKDSKTLLIVVGLATLARVGISEAMAREVYGRISTSRPFQNAMDALAGIVDQEGDGRLYARHELYIRHIIENVISFDELQRAIVATFRYYLKYNIPVVRSVGRRDGLLFRFILNHRFIADNEKRKHVDGVGVKIFEEFEVEFQLDGHFWLQYGLYLANRQEIPKALTMLRRSIDAYPENAFAVHAYADIQLRYAASRTNFDTETKELIAHAVASLKEMDASSTLEVDVYPAVTLANGHISALLKHGEKAAAQKVAREYYERLKQIEKLFPTRTLTNAKERVFVFATTGEWQEKYMLDPSRTGTRKRRRFRVKGRP